MLYDLRYKSDVAELNTKLSVLKSKKATVELTEKKGTRTVQQNRAIHLYCKQVAELLNDLGWEFRYIGIKGRELGLKYTMSIVKETLWRPIQMAMFDKESTTKLTKIEVSEVAEQIERHFAVTEGVDIPFPSIENHEFGQCEVMHKK